MADDPTTPLWNWDTTPHALLYGQAADTMPLGGVTAGVLGGVHQGVSDFYGTHQDDSYNPDVTSSLAATSGYDPYHYDPLQPSAVLDHYDAYQPHDVGHDIGGIDFSPDFGF